jgi:hypothetical protein
MATHTWEPKFLVALGAIRQDDCAVPRAELCHRHVPPDIHVAKETHGGAFRNLIKRCSDILFGDVDFYERVEQTEANERCIRCTFTSG